MNNKNLRASFFSITALIVLSISGCSQYRAPGHVQSQQAKAPVYAPHTQSRLASQRMRRQNTQANVNRQQRSITPSQQRPQSSPSQQRPTSSNFQVRQRIVDIANRSIGTGYRYGGRSPQSGFDCSGLMHYVHKQSLGIDIPRTAAQQRDRSRTISYAQLQPGDMLFFKTGKRTNHVGVYIGGRKFIHASTGSRRVKVAKMDSKYWHQRFVKFGTFL